MEHKELETHIKGCKKGNAQSQRKIYEAFYSEVFSVCLRYASTGEEAKELTNDSFFKAFTRIEQYMAGTNFGGWLYTIARHTALDRYRSSINRPKIESEEFFPIECILDSEAEIFHKIELNEKLACIHKLPPAYRLTFNLYVMEGYTHEEIAEALGVTVGTSKSNLFKARHYLRQLLEKIYYS